MAYEEKNCVMHNITDKVLDGSLDNTIINWCELPYDTKVRKIINYSDEQLNKGVISEKQHYMLKIALISYLEKNILVNYDVVKRCIIDVPCLVYDNVIECYDYVEKEKTVKKSLIKENISKI